ncbi:MAG: nitroreductase family protein [Lentimicrobium sp.]|nr:nitroreductase family protein [Lentimicrobium sp.]
MDIKLASNDHPIHPLLKQRWSPRAFENKFIEPKLVRSLFEAARWAPSSSNIQPWYFIIGFKGDDTYEAITKTLVEFNLLWATRAPLLFVTVARQHNNRGEINVSAMYDLGQSVAMLTIQAMSERLYVHQMGGFDVEKTKKIFEIPDGYVPATVVAVGYMGDYTDLHPNLIKSEIAPRERRIVQESVFSGKFGQSSKIY